MHPESEVRRVAHDILGRIVSGAYPAGLRLPAENDLAAGLSCGRSTIREALRHLAGLGVVQSRRGSGAMVLDFRREGTPALLPWYILAGRFDRPVADLAREMLAVRTHLAAQAVRLAARYGDAPAIAEARTILARAPRLAKDPAAHGSNELDFFRALVTGSGIWPAVWLANVFWGPLRELHDRLAGAVGTVPADYHAEMTRLLDLIEARDDVRAEAHVVAWFARVDEGLVPALEQLLGFTAQAGIDAISPPTRRPDSGPVSGAPAASTPAPVTPKRTSKRKAMTR